MEFQQPIQRTAATQGTTANASSKRRHNTLKERIKRSMDGSSEGGASLRRRSSTMLAAASALASLAGGGDPKTTNDTNTERRVETKATQPTKNTNKAPIRKASDSHETRWRAASTAEEVPVTFPQKLMVVLDNEELSDIITWLPHGKGFIILQKKKFAAEVMKMYFKHSKFTSFTRKLNRWGFTRIPKGPEAGSYYHKYFQKGNHHLCLQMHCQSKPIPATNTDKNEEKGSDSPRSSPPTTVNSAKNAAKSNAPSSPGSNVAAAMSKLRVETPESAHEGVHQKQVDFSTTLSRQQELLRQDKEDQRRMELVQEQQQKQQERKARLAALYQQRKTRDIPSKKKVEVPSRLPQTMSAFAPAGVPRQNQSLVSSLASSVGQSHLHQSLPSSFTPITGTSPYASLRNSWNSEPNNPVTSVEPSVAKRRRLHHQAKEIDWSKINNYSIQDKKIETGRGDITTNQTQLYAPISQKAGMTNRAQMMMPSQAPSYETMLNDYKGWTTHDALSSAKQQHVIKNAFDVLQASNDRGYSSIMMQRELEMAQRRLAPVNYAPQSTRVPTRFDAAMQAQMRNLEEQYQKARSAQSDYLLAQSPTRRVEQLQQRMKLLSSSPSFQSHGIVPSNPPSSKYPPGGVRRASAA